MEEAGGLRVFPQQVEVAQRPRHADDVALAPSEDLIGDVDAATLDVAGLGPCLVVAIGVPGGPVVKPGVLTQDASFQLTQLRARLDTELLGQDGAQLAVCAQRIGLPPAAVSAGRRWDQNRSRSA